MKNRIFSNEWLAKIEGLRKKYAPKSKINLVDELIKLHNLTLKMGDIQTTLRVQKNDRLALNKALKLEAKKAAILNTISAECRHNIDVFYQNGNNMPTNALSKVSMQAPPQSIFSMHDAINDKFYKSCSLFINTSGKPTKRNLTYSKPQLYISHLIQIFHYMTKTLPECSSNRELENGDDGYDEYTGKFYNFLLELNPLLETAFKLTLGTRKVIGKYANALIKQYKSEIQHKKSQSKINH